VSERLLRISDGSGVANNTNTANNANNEQGNEIACYAYDPFGRRIKKIVRQALTADSATGTTLYFYSDEGLIAEVDGNAGSTTLGNITTTYGWVPASANTGTWGTAPQWKRDHAGQSGATNPQGDASTNGVEHYYHVDHLGTSQRLTNAQGETTWRMVSEAFGKTFVDTTLAPATTGTTTNNLRFPGQYEDVETGTYYNFMRTYLPMVGRYGESDPIGLGGGLNTYSYVGGNPLMYTDPTGEFIFVPGAIVGGIVGGVTAAATGQSILGGAVSGAIGGAFPGGGILINAAIGAVAGVAGYLADPGCPDGMTPTFGVMLQNAALGGLGGAVGRGIGFGNGLQAVRRGAGGASAVSRGYYAQASGGAIYGTSLTYAVPSPNCTCR
jgi:RHS repeat-associated protein